MDTRPVAYLWDYLPFWVKKNCRKCNTKLIIEKKQIDKVVTEYYNGGSYHKFNKPAVIRITYSEYTCPKCGCVYSVRDLRGGEPSSWYREWNKEKREGF